MASQNNVSADMVQNTIDEFAKMFSKKLSLQVEKLIDEIHKKHPQISKDELQAIWSSQVPSISLKSSPVSRVKTDKNRKCDFIKKSGPQKGEVCGKNCVIDSEFCVAHSVMKQTQEKKEASKVPAPAFDPTSKAIGSDEELTALKVDQLKGMCLLHSIPYSKGKSKPKKIDLVNLLIHKRNELNGTLTTPPVPSTPVPSTPVLTPSVPSVKVEPVVVKTEKVEENQEIQDIDMSSLEIEDLDDMAYHE